jgi:hypothetical protein
MIIPLGDIKTNFGGYGTLTSVFEQVARVSPPVITLDWGNVRWFDANMSACLGALKATLEAHGTELFHISISDQIQRTLARNGFLVPALADNFGTAIPFERFSTSEAKSFAGYTEAYLRGRGMPVMSSALRRQFLLPPTPRRRMAFSVRVRLTPGATGLSSQLST